MRDLDKISARRVLLIWHIIGCEGATEMGILHSAEFPYTWPFINYLLAPLLGF